MMCKNSHFSKAVLLLWVICVIYVLCLSCFFRLFIDALWSPAGKGLTSWLLFVVFNCFLVTFICGILGQLWYLIVSIPDICRLSYFKTFANLDLYDNISQYPRFQYLLHWQDAMVQASLLHIALPLAYTKYGCR